MRTETLALIKRLTEDFPGFSLTQEQAGGWDQRLAEYDAVQLAYAADMLARHHRHGPPNLPHVHSAICGVLERVQEPVTDLWGCTPLHANGAPVTQAAMRRVGLDGEPLPAAILERLPAHVARLDAEAAPAAYTAIAPPDEPPY